METIKSFSEFGKLLAETKWGQGESPLVKFEGDFIVFPQKQRRVDRKENFRLRLGNNTVEQTAEQIADCYRTRDLTLPEYLRHMRTAAGGFISSLNRSAFLGMMQEGSFAAADVGSAGPSPPSSLAAGHDESGRKRDRPAGDERRGESKSSRVAGDESRAPERLSDVLKAEIQYFDRNAALNAVRSFQEVIDLDQKAKTTQEEQKKVQKQKRSKPLGTPIIVVPPNETAVLNIYNIKSFLEDMLYVPTDEIKKKLNPNETKPEVVYVTRRKHPQAGDIRFKVVDSVANFDDATWDRVVAVMVSGQAWQLKGWKWPTPADILAHVKGLYVYFDDAKITDLVKGWNVVALPIKHQSRNKDIVQVHEIWRQIDDHLERKKPQILQSLVDEYETRMRAEREARQKGMQAQLEDEEDEDDLDNSQNAMIDA